MLPPFSWSFIPLCWLLRWRKRDREVCRGVLQHGYRFFNLLFKPFSRALSVFIAFCFHCIGVRDTTSQWQQRHIWVVVSLKTTALKKLLRAVCLLPRALLGRPCRERKKHPGRSSSNGPPDRGGSPRGSCKCPRKSVPPLLSMGGEWPVFAPSLHALLHKELLRKKVGKT